MHDFNASAAAAVAAAAVATAAVVAVAIGQTNKRNVDAKKSFVLFVFATVKMTFVAGVVLNEHPFVIAAKHTIDQENNQNNRNIRTLEH